MKIGILSDSHGQCDRLGRAVEVLVQRGADVVLHCGDIGHDDCVRLLAGSGKPVYAVCGNVDRDVTQMMALAAECGVDLHWEVIEVPLGNGQYLVATHGHDSRLVEELLAGQQFPYLCLGHSHRRRDERVGLMRVINPGALHRARPYTMALLDTAADRVEFIELQD
jgi:putative phosphoesterase